MLCAAVLNSANVPEGTNTQNIRINRTHFRVATGQGKVREIQGKGKVREFCAGSGKFEIFRKVWEIQENPLKVREI